MISMTVIRADRVRIRAVHALAQALRTGSAVQRYSTAEILLYFIFH
jgi:hypothetical protein